jgi:hypothetical protein
VHQRQRRAARLCVALAVSLIVPACHRASAGTPDGPRTPVDSLEGVVHVAGTNPFPQTTLAPDNGGRAVTLDGSASLRHLDGLRIAAVGALTGNHLAVARFTVLAANGVAATDGMLALNGDALVLVTAAGKRYVLVNPSPVLRANVGHRVWVSGPLDREPVAYGIID